MHFADLFCDLIARSNRDQSVNHQTDCPRVSWSVGVFLDKCQCASRNEAISINEDLFGLKMLMD